MLLGSIYRSRVRSKKEGNGDSGGEQINRLPARLLLDKVQIQQETRAIAGDCFRWNKDALEMFEIHLVINSYHQLQDICRDLFLWDREKELQEEVNRSPYVICTWGLHIFVMLVPLPGVLFLLFCTCSLLPLCTKLGR